MTTHLPDPVPVADASFATPAHPDRLERAGRAVTAHGFTVEVLDDAATAGSRVAALLTRGSTVASVTEDARARTVYGRPSAIGKLLIINAEPIPGRSIVLLLREPIGY